MPRIMTALYLVILMVLLSSANSFKLNAGIKQSKQIIHKMANKSNETKSLQKLLYQQYSAFLQKLPFDISFLQLEENRIKYSSYIAKDQDLSVQGNEEYRPYELEATVEEFRVCPSQLVSIERSDRYPKARLFAKCLCQKCLGNTIKRYPYSRSTCMPVNVLMPVLIRSQTGKNETEWKFFLEPVPVSCACGTKQSPEN